MRGTNERGSNLHSLKLDLDLSTSRRYVLSSSLGLPLARPRADRASSIRPSVPAISQLLSLYSRYFSLFSPFALPLLPREICRSSRSLARVKGTRKEGMTAVPASRCEKGASTIAVESVSEDATAVRKERRNEKRRVRKTER